MERLSLINYKDPNWKKKLGGFKIDPTLNWKFAEIIKI